MSDQEAQVIGVAAGVPFVALPPTGSHGGEPAPLIIVWHLNDPPRSAVAMAAALPMAGVAVWRVYVDLPMHGRRQLPGGLEEFMRLGYQDAVLKAFEPQVTQAVNESRKCSPNCAPDCLSPLPRLVWWAPRLARFLRSWSWPAARCRSLQRHWSARSSSSPRSWRPTSAGSA